MRHLQILAQRLAHRKRCVAMPIIEQSRKGLLSLAPRPGVLFPAGSLGTGTSCSTWHLVSWSVSCLFSSDHSHASDPHSACQGKPGSWGTECVPWFASSEDHSGHHQRSSLVPGCQLCPQCLSQTLSLLLVVVPGPRTSTGRVGE